MFTFIEISYSRPNTKQGKAYDCVIVVQSVLCEDEWMICQEIV